MPPTSIGDYTILAPLGSGGMGEVFLAHDAGLRRNVAIKVLSRSRTADDNANRRFIKEAQALAQVEHPNICPVYEVGRDGDTVYIAMQYVAGETLAQRLRRAPPSVGEALDIAAQVLDALAHAHARGIVHRDIKPENIMLTDEGRVKVLDFGLATVDAQAHHGSSRTTESRLTAPGIAIGTAPYMSPEQTIGADVDTRSDIFSLGAVLYECLTSQRAFTGGSPIEISAQVLKGIPPPPSTVNAAVPAGLDAVVVKAIEKQPHHRYQSAADMRADLARLRITEAQPTLWRALAAAWRSQGRSPAEPDAARSRRRVAALAVALVLIVAAVAYFVATRSTRTEPDRQAWYERGVDAVRNGAYFHASRLLQRAVEADPGAALAHARLGEAYAELDNKIAARDALLKAHVLVPERSRLGHEERLYLEAVSAQISGDTATAIARYEDIVALNPGRPESHVDLGRAYEKANNLDKALEHFGRAAALQPDYATAFLRLGMLYGRQQKDALSDEAFARATAIFEDQANVEGRAEVHYQRGFLLRRTSHIAEARVQLQQAYDLARAAGNETQQILALLQLSSVAFAEGAPTQAQQRAGEAVGLAQQRGLQHVTIRGLVDLGNSFLAAGDGVTAERYYREALGYAQTHKDAAGEARAGFMLGNVLITTGATAEGLPYVEGALAFFQRGGYLAETMQAMIMVGRARRNNGNFDGATQVFVDLLGLSKQANNAGQVANAHDELGRVLYLQEQYPQAQQHFVESAGVYEKLASQLDLIYSLLNLANVHWQLGRYRVAEDLFAKSARAAQPESYKGAIIAIRQYQAEMELTRRRFAAASAAMQQALALGPAHDAEAAEESRRIPGLIKVYSGDRNAGLALCRDALQQAKGDPWLVAKAQLSLAEALLESGASRDAIAQALLADQTFSRTAQHASKWRAFAVAAIAARSIHDARASDYAARASAAADAVQAAWGIENYRSYMSRPDVSALRKQLDAIGPSRDK